ncbi:BTAD domain-containing putative transcriptional regulator [Promicromonospora sp. NPDC060271]|uniref:BTAD domain-containing putative transcriptional regulator n=1 Tax=Promicromonospora sp. NPDC060271 TaxID=3347089 RepID=UPI00366112D5
MSTAEFRVLGPLEAVIEGTSVPLGGPRPRALLGVLLANVGQPVSTGRLIDQLWGEQPPATVRTSLQVHVSGLRKVLGDRLVTAPNGYLLEAEPTEVDALSFETLVIAARAVRADHPARAATDLATALDLWRGEPYAGVPDGPDVLAARTRLSELRLAAMEERFDADLAIGRHAHLVSELSGLVAQHPTRQRLAGLHLLALYRCGRVTEALESFRELEARLAREFGVEPAGEVAALARAIERRDPTLDPPSSIPVSASRFIGRRHELERLADRLGRTRLLTLTGPGGAGKTRLAFELARDTEADHRDGVQVVELAASAPGTSVAHRVATAFGIRPRTNEPIIQRLVAQLRGTRALIVLDNCEHLADDCARVTADLLAGCEGLRILATSREPLGVPGEQVWPVSGLPRTEAIRLLAVRGAEARRGFTIDAGNMSAAAELCRRLSDLPLAIELAAAQLRALSLREIGDGLGLSDTRSRTTPDRHRTMRATIDWSYELLTPDEQAMLRRLSVFAGGFGRDAAEAVTGRPSDSLVRLADRSLLSVEPLADGVRYRMLDLVRRYAAERLERSEPGEVGRLRQRHAAWYAEQAETAGRERFDPSWLPRLTREIPDLRAAVGWCLGEGDDLEGMLRIAASLWWFWGDHGLAVEAWDWLRRGLATADSVPDRLRAETYRAASALARANGDDREARRLGEQALRVCRELPDPLGVVSALNGLAFTALAQADHEAALEYAQECRQLTEAMGDTVRTASAFNPLGMALRGLGRLAEARAAFSSALERSEALGYVTGEAFASSNLAGMARAEGDLAGSRALYLRSLRLYRGAELETGQLDALDGLAGLALADGRADEALRLLTITDRERERLDARPFSVDREDDREATRSGAHAALGERAGAVAASAYPQPLGAVVDELL